MLTWKKLLNTTLTLPATSTAPCVGIEEKFTWIHYIPIRGAEEEAENSEKHEIEHTVRETDF